MSVRTLYNAWSSSYDLVENKTRDLELLAGRQLLGNKRFESIVEIGCGTGKNTGWLSGLAGQLLSIDFSEGMLEQAKQKITEANVQFLQADITKPWPLTIKADLITFSLVLEHIPHLDGIMQQCCHHLNPGGTVYICELHPFKQYTGSKARFETSEGTSVLECYTHHFSDYTAAALYHGMCVVDVKEWFDEEQRTGIPRLVSFLFVKK